MSSTLLVPVTTVTAVKPHPNADRLSIAEVLGWQVVTGKDEFKPGDKVVYIPPDAILPVELSDALGVTQHLSKGRVRQVKLRGEPSFGFVVGQKAFKTLPTSVVAEDCAVLAVGDNIADLLRITKYEPPVRPTAGDAEVDHPLFHKFTDVENFRNYPDIILPGEDVVITEKIHGTNCRIGAIEGEIMAGSMSLRRKQPGELGLTATMESNLYWFPWTIGGVRLMLTALGRIYKQVILFGEVYGKVQSLHYDKPNALGFLAFGLVLDGKFVDFEDFKSRMDGYGIPRVPVVYQGKFEREALKTLTSSKSHLAHDQIMEGVVIQPIAERSDARIGRVILKYLSEDYLFSKGVTDFKEV